MTSWTDFPWFDTPQERARDEYDRGRMKAIEIHRTKLCTSGTRDYWREQEISRKMGESFGTPGIPRKTRDQAIGELREESLESHRKWLRSHTEPFRSGYNDEMGYLTRFDTLAQRDDDW
ncbi:hypothetical protein KY326_04485 [Candidatus Woesearchaeota archaeon]|nr:hypothetical protein [Candidatus Woesearchaeota archaeon]